MERWIGKVVVVTGSSTGIGAAISKSLADKGIIVVGLARREDKIKELAATSTGKIHAVKCDVTDEGEIKRAFQWAEDTLGGVDILVNNAGVLKLSSLGDGSTADWREMFDLNVLGLSICTREALKSMKKKGGEGHIFHINSIMGHQVPQLAHGPHFGPYCATKFAVTALTEALRLELQGMNSLIKVTSISPGIVLTDLTINISMQMGMKLPETDIPSFLLAQDVADALVYALSTRPGIQVHELILQPIGILKPTPLS